MLVINCVVNLNLESLITFYHSHLTERRSTPDSCSLDKSTITSNVSLGKMREDGNFYF